MYFILGVIAGVALVTVGRALCRKLEQSYYNATHL